MSKPEKHFYEFGPFRLDPAERLLLREDRPVQLTPKAFDTLVVLVSRSGHLVSKDELLKKVWGDHFVEENSLDKSISALRKALGEDSANYIATVRGAGYRFTGNVRERTGAEDVVLHERTRTHILIEDDEKPGLPAHKIIETQPVRHELAAAPTSRASRKWPLAALIVCVILFGAIRIIFFVRNHRAASSQPESSAGKNASASQPKTLAVLPFKPLVGKSTDPYLEIGIADSLITRLSNVRQIVVRPTSAVQKFNQPERDPADVGRRLGVETVLDGSIQRQGDRLRVTVQLISVKDGSQLWGKTFDEKFTDIFAVQDAISEKVTEALALKLSGEEQTGLAKRYTENAEAYQLYLLGRFYWNKRSEEGIKKAIAYFDQAIEKDPNYALAYAGLSQCYIVLDAYYLLPPQEAIPKAKAAATRALEIDDTLAEAYAALATYYYDWDWPAAERQFKRAIELNPNYATAHQWYAEFLVNQGRFDEGIAEIKRARELDPLSLIINTVLGRSLYQARQYDQGIEQLRNTIEMDPNFVPAHRHLGQAYEAKGMYSEAVAEMQKAVTLSGSTPEYMAVLGQAYALSGKRAEAMKIVEELKEQSKQRYISACGIALIYAGLGEKDRAFEWLEKAYQEHDYGLIYIRVAPGLESLRSDPRFADLVRRVGLPQ